MKTNVILKSVDRSLFGVTIKQNTIEGQMLSVSDLQKAYDKARFMNGWAERQISDVVRSKSFKERIYYTLLELDLISLQFLPFMEMREKPILILNKFHFYFDISKIRTIFENQNKINNKNTKI